MQMEKQKQVVSCMIVLFGFISFSCCITAEFKKAKAKDMNNDGSHCSLPQTSAFGLGITALLSLSAAQIIGTSVAGNKLFARDKKTGSKKAFVTTITLLVVSWASFGLAVTLLSTATNMNSGQPDGRGWLDGKCYIVKPGIYAGTAVLVILVIISTLGLTFTTKKASPGTLSDEQNKPETIL